MDSDSSEETKITSLETLDAFLRERDNSRNTLYISDIPKACKEYPCILGIDEAGRGPVLGPMVYGTAFCPINEAIVLETLGCDDSKKLTEAKRIEIFEKMQKETKKVGWAVEVIAPNSICNSMLSRSKISLNQVSTDSAIKLIRAAENYGVKISQIFVDTVGPPEKYQAYLEGLFPKYKITVAKKADSTYPIVSAASICAKVSRDRALEVWTFPENIEVTHCSEFGSGYPADPITKKFLVENCDPVFGYPQLVRFSWSTASKALEGHAYEVEFEEADDDEDNKGVSGNTSITSFFRMTPKDKIKKAQHQFFTDRCLSRKVEF